MADGDDDLDKWITAACEGDPVEFTEFIDEEAGPMLTKDELKQAWDRLAKPQSPDAFRSEVYPLCQRCASKDWFRRPQLKFLHDAFVLAEFVGHRPADLVWLAGPREQWPDGYVRIGNETHKVEVTSEHGGRKLGDEYGNVTKPEMVPSIAEPVEKIADCLDSAIQAKIAKHYGSRAWLIVYLNMADFFGSQQAETERAIRAIKQKHTGAFDATFVLWKDNVL